MERLRGDRTLNDCLRSRDQEIALLVLVLLYYLGHLPLDDEVGVLESELRLWEPGVEGDMLLEEQALIRLAKRTQMSSTTSGERNGMTSG